MHFLQTLVFGVSALASLAAAQAKVQFTSLPQSVSAGKPITLTWIGGNQQQPVTITLRKGPSTNLETIAVLTAAATGGTFTWTPDTKLANGADYALEITQNGDVNYTGLFSLMGGSTSVPSASVSSAAAASSASESLASVSSAFISSASASASASSVSSVSTASVSSASRASVVSSILSSISASTHSAMATASTTSATATSSSKASSTSSAAPSSTSAPGNAGAALSSSLALVLGSFAAILILN